MNVRSETAATLPVFRDPIPTMISTVLFGDGIMIGVPRGRGDHPFGQDIPTFHGRGDGYQLPTGNDKAKITGDFVLLGGEVNPVIKRWASQQLLG